MTGLFIFGFLLGMRHALDADHLVAVAALATRNRSWRDAMRQGVVWGLGHTLTLLVFGALVLLLDATLSDKLAQMLESAVGVMLILLGLDVLRRLLRERIHFHTHRHDNGTIHYHAHSHHDDIMSGQRHDPLHHEHPHPAGFPTRALLVGLMHGMAGSAALILLTLQTTPSIMTGLLYIALFGFGSILGMALLSIAIAFPLRYSAGRATWFYNGMQATVGIVAVIIGINTI